jgi:hypothetical protein
LFSQEREHLAYIDFSLAGFEAPAAPGTGENVVISWFILQFTVKTVCKAVMEPLPGIGASRNARKACGLTGIPGAKHFERLLAISCANVLNEEETMAGGTDVGAGATADAGFAGFLPIGILIFFLDQGSEVIQREGKILVGFPEGICNFLPVFIAAL